MARLPPADRVMVKAAELHVGDYLTYASQVVVKVERGVRPVGYGAGQRTGVTATCRRGPDGPDIIHHWWEDTPCWVRVPRLKIQAA